MRRTSLFVITAFVAGLGIGYFARSTGIGTTQRSDKNASELAAIEKLHKKNIEVTLSQDPQGLLDLWTDNGVLLEPGSPPVVGKRTVTACSLSWRSVNRTVHETTRMYSNSLKD